MKNAVLAVRVILGAWLLLSGLNHFVFHVVALPPGTQPLAVQLMNAVVHTGLIDVAMGIELVAGALILVGVMAPAALCVVMPTLVCSAYWAVILERDPLWAALSLLAVALAAVLMLAYIDYYKGMLRRHALAFGEA